MRRLAACGLPRGGAGRIGRGELADEEAAALLQCGLLIRDADGYRLNFPCFTAAQFADWVSRFSLEDDALADTLCAWILSVREAFARFTPVRLESQINQWVSYYLFRLVGQVTDECCLPRRSLQADGRRRVLRPRRNRRRIVASSDAGCRPYSVDKKRL